jgi:hypothetical protein
MAKSFLALMALMAILELPAAAQVCTNPVFPTQVIQCTSYVDYVQPHSGAVALAVADFNRDGKLDLVIAENGGGGGNTEMAVQLGNGDGTFQAPIFLGTCCIDANWAVPGDFNGDGIPDIAASAAAGLVTIWLGDATGNFTLKQQISATPFYGGPIAGAVGDFNGDGKLDIVILNNNVNPGVAQIYLGNGDGAFPPLPNAVVTVGTVNQNSPNSVVVGDFNRDGFLDFATANRSPYNDSMSVVMGNGNGTFQTAVNYPTTNNLNTVNAVSIVTGDFNHDGYLDLAMLLQGGNSQIAVFLNAGNGTFGTPSFYPAGGSATDPAFAVDLSVEDFNKDGNPDLVFAANWRGGIGVLMGNADGSFGWPTWWTTDVDAAGVATGDFNGDGNPDIVVSAVSDNTVTVVLGNGDGTFKSVESYEPFIISSGYFPPEALPHPSAVTLGDFNGDGKPDMAVVDAANSNVTILLNNGRGTFTEMANYLTGGGQPPLMAVAADVNNDGQLDLVMSLTSTGSQSSFSVLLGNGDGTFQAPLVYSNGTGNGSDTIAVADVNGDGKPDVISNTQSWSLNSSFYVSLGNGDGTFNPAIATPALCPAGAGSGAVYLAVGDLNGDGNPDIVGGCNAGLHLATISVLLGNGDGTFGTPTQFTSGTTPVSIAIGDFNEDGNPDLAVVDNSPTPQVSILLGNGDGTFQNPTSFSIFPNSGSGWGWFGQGFPSPDFIVTADFNLDGHVDLLVGDYNAHQSTFNGQGSYNIGVQLFLGNGNGTFQPVQNYLAGRNATYMAVADLNGDGYPDVAVVSPADNSVNVLVNIPSPVTPRLREKPR